MYRLSSYRTVRHLCCLKRLEVLKFCVLSVENVWFKHIYPYRHENIIALSRNQTSPMRAKEVSLIAQFYSVKKIGSILGSKFGIVVRWKTLDNS